MTQHCSIPDDVCVEICTFIHSGGYPYSYTKPEADRTLSSLATVSRVWCFASRRIQFETTCARGIGHLTDLITLLGRENYLATHIRNLTIGRTIGFDVDLPTWKINPISIRTINSLIPHLRHLTIGYVHGRLTIGENGIVGDPQASAPLPYTRLTRLTVFSTMFIDASRAKAFFGGIPTLKDLTFLDVTPKFVSLLPAYIPDSLETLRLTEYESWVSMLGPERRPYPALPMRSVPSLTKFYYHNLSAYAACVIYPILIQLSTDAEVTITLSIRPSSTIEEAQNKPWFDFLEFNDRLSQVARAVEIENLSFWMTELF